MLGNIFIFDSQFQVDWEHPKQSLDNNCWVWNDLSRNSLDYTKSNLRRVKSSLQF